MRILNLIPGSRPWHAHRSTRFNASDAPAMLGDSPYTTRAELLHRIATGITPEVDAATQHRFDDGHAVEPLLLRLHAEPLLGEPVHPFVGVPDDESSRLSASFDGCTFVGDIVAECKLLNQRLRAAFADMETIAPAHRERSAAKCLPIDYRIQMEQQIRIAGADRALFLTGELRGDGTLGDVLSCWYYPDDALWTRITGGWAQFEVDLAAYVPPAKTVEAVAAPMEALPAVIVRMDGDLKVIDNLPAFGEALRAFVAKIPKQPTSDEDFATCEAACKALKKAEESLDQSEAAALASMADVEKMRRLVGELKALARDTRLAREKDVKRRKEEIKLEQVTRGKQVVAEHIAGLNTRLGKPYMPALDAKFLDFAGAISGLKKFDNLRGAIDDKIAEAKIEANRIADLIDANLKHLREHAKGYEGHFADAGQLVLKDAEFVAMTVKTRIADAQAEEARRAEALAEKERERIRAEEADKLRKEQEAAAQREREAAHKHPNGAPMFSTTTIKENGDALMLDERGNRSVFCDVDEGESRPAANSPLPEKVTQLRVGNPTLKIGDIQAAFGIPITAVFIETTLKIAPAKRENRSVWWNDTDWPRIRQALMFHIERAPAPAQLEAA
jgi:predicted phage-related endonuclease